LEGTESLCFTFTEKTYGEPVGSVTLISEGTSPDPLPVYMRGFYFDGTNELLAQNLILNPRFSVEMWVRADVFGYLFTTTYSEGTMLLNFEIASVRQPKYSHLADVVNSTETPMGVWVKLSVTVDDTAAGLFVNGESIVIGSNTLTALFIDDVANRHLVGSGFTGFIYQVCFYQYVITPEVDNPSCGLDYCYPCASGLCLPECELNQNVTGYPIGASCSDCRPECTDGCIRQTDCRTCLEKTCENCPEKYGTCKDCITYASKDDNDDCVCVNKVYLEEDAVCGNCIVGCGSCVNSRACNECVDGYYKTY
jgi:hypothetical protein